MELAFISRSQPERSYPLEDALVMDPFQTKTAILSAINDLVFASPYLPKKHLWFSFEALDILLCRFRNVLSSCDMNSTLTRKEEMIIQAARDGDYSQDEVEGAFFQYGGYGGIIALILYFRETESIEKRWRKVNEESREWLVKRVVRLLPGGVVQWISQYSINRSCTDAKPLQFLGRHAGKKHKWRKVQATNSCPTLQPCMSVSVDAVEMSAEPPKRHQAQLLEISSSLSRQDAQHDSPSTTALSPIQSTVGSSISSSDRLTQAITSQDTQSRSRFILQLLPINNISSELIMTQDLHSNQYEIDTVQSLHASSDQPVADAVCPPSVDHCHCPVFALNENIQREKRSQMTDPENNSSLESPLTRRSTMSRFTSYNAPRTMGQDLSSDDESIHRSDVKGFFSDRSRVSHAPSPPQALLVSENLFHNIKVYFEDSCRDMIFDDYGTLITANGANVRDDLCNDFDSYCFTATMFIEKGLHVEFRCALSKASALVEQILLAEHPRTLACFLEVLIHLIQTRLPGVASILRDFIKRMSAKVIRKGHPWGQICWLLSELDSESLDQAMAQTWKCITDTFDSELGMFSRLAVSVRLDYIKRVYGITNHPKEEQLLRELLAQLGSIPRLPTPRVMLNLAHNLDRQGRHIEAEEIALEVLSLLQGYEIYAKRVVERIESLKIVSRSRFHQGKTLAAEQTLREAIRMIVHQWGIRHSWVPEFMNVLEGWLRVWGRDEDANNLRGEMKVLIRKDEIDEHLDGVQGLRYCDNI